ncbi:MAG: carboxy terminal-processing peptidase [Endozoicomonadaceae bacterium]|nr:carboxy terminal-processing peptidase [Endozoicomonadaceae bacterium]
MYFKARTARLNLLFALLLSVTSVAVFARDANNTDTDLHKFFEQTVVPLKPTLNQAIANVNVVQLLQRNSYDDIVIDGSSSKRIFQGYLDTLDRQRSFFLASDINSFEPYRHMLDSAIKSGNLKPAFDIFNRYMQRSEERIRFTLKHLDSGIDNVDFHKNELLIVDREKESWLTDKTMQEDLWRRQLKDNILRMKLNDKSMTEIQELLYKRYTNQLRRLHQTQSEDVFQLYLNSFTQLYDPHTQYFSPQRAETFDISMSLSLEGIGAVLQSEDEYTKVISIVPAGPADKAGQLKTSDRIIAVSQGKNGKFDDVVGMRLDEVVKLIRGPKGTMVRLEVIPADSKDGKTRIYPISRDKVKLEEQSAKKKIVTVKQNNHKYRIGIIDIPAFYIDFKAAQAGDPNYKSTTRDVRALLKDLSKEKIDGLIIDLRSNGGGSLQEANQLSGLFISEGPTVVVRDSRGRIDAQQDPDPEEVYSGPMVVLINRLSASASEIFAGAMQDYRRAVVTGSQSFGKGTVQTIQPLNHGQLKLTIGKFYRVSGQSTQNRGVIPDISYPSLLNTDEIGESALPNALSWDEINPVQFKPFKSLTFIMPTLRKRHESRISNNPDFRYFQALKTLQQNYDTKTVISLNEKERRSETNNIRSKRLKLENQMRQAKGKPIYKSLDQLEEEQNANVSQYGKSDDDKPEDDALLMESGNILTDLIELSLRSKRQAE